MTGGLAGKALESPKLSLSRTESMGRVFLYVLITRRSSVQICPPQPFLLIHKGLLDSTSKPFFFLAKIWERNHFSRVNLGPPSVEKFTKFSRRLRSMLVHSSALANAAPHEPSPGSACLSRFLGSLSVYLSEPETTHFLVPLVARFAWRLIETRSILTPHSDSVTEVHLKTTTGMTDST